MAISDLIVEWVKAQGLLMNYFVDLFIKIYELVGSSYDSILIQIRILILYLLLDALVAPKGGRCIDYIRRLNSGFLFDLFSFLLVHSKIMLIAGMTMAFGVLYFVKTFFQWLMTVSGFSAIEIAGEISCFILYFLIYEFLAYWIHRAFHKFPSLWELHKFHHSAKEFTGLAALRDHPLERALTYFLVSFVPMVVIIEIGASWQLLILQGFTLIGLFKHSNWQSDWGVFGRFLFQSPAHHRIHHGVDNCFYDRNFSNLFQMYDVIFGTAYDPSPRERGGR